MTIGTTEILAYALAGVGLSLATHSITKLVSHGLNATMANAQLVKLAVNGQVSRLIKLCSAAPNSYMRAVKVAALAGIAAKSRDRITLEATIGPAFDAKGKELTVAWKRIIELGLLGVMLVGGAIGLALSEEPRQVPLQLIGGVGGVIALVASYLAVRRPTLARALATTRTTVIPALVQAFVDGATGDSPPPEPTPKPDPTAAPDANAHTFRISRGDVFERTVTLSASVIKVGTIPNAAIRLDDPKVSRLHAIIELDDDHSTIIDLGSQTGTFVNGGKVNKSKLVDGDTIGIGPFRIEVHRGTEALAPFRTPAVVANRGEPAKVAHAPSLRDGVCPICSHETIRTIQRADTRFEVLVCTACGYTQEFADVTRLDPAGP